MLRFALCACLLATALVPAAAARDGAATPPRGAVLFLGGPAEAAYAMDAGRRLKELVPSPVYEAAWSPDGRMLAFTRERGGELWVRREPGGELARLAGDARDLTWSPDGRRIAFSEPRGRGTFGISVVGVDGRGKRRLTTPPGRESDVEAAWSPDGGKIAFWRLELGDDFPELIIMTADGGRVLGSPVLSGFVSSSPGSLSWSPNGRQLAFSIPGRRSAHVWSENGGRHEIVHSGTVALAWSPDGAHIALSGRVGARTGTFVVRPDGTQLRRIASVGSLVQPSWSPDSRWIAVSAPAAGTPPASDVWVVPAAGGKPRRLTEGWRYGYHGLAPRWHPSAWPTRNLAGPFVAPDNPTDSRADSDDFFSPGPITQIAADGEVVAVVRSVRGRDCVELWDRAAATVTRLGNCYRLHGLGLASRRVAVASSSSTLSGNRLHRLHTGTLEVPRLLDADVWCSGDCFNTPLGNIEGDGDALVFTSFGPCVPTECAARSPQNERLFRLERTRAVQIASSPGAVTPLSVDGGRILVDRGDGTLELLRADGSSARTFRNLHGFLGAKIQGRDLVVLYPGSIVHYDTESGERLHEWPLTGGEPRLEDVHGGIAAYVSGDYVHVVRLADGRDVALPPLGRQPKAELEAPGLYYAYRIDDRYQGRVTSIPLDELPFP